MKSNNKRFSPHQTGFTLVEIMVGLVIGLLATIVIMKVLSTFETQKRTTTGTADAQTNGNIALYNIERELQMAGYPLIPYGKTGVADSPLECTTLTINGTLDTTTPNRLSPITITDGGASGSDTITIRYGNSLGGGIPTQIAATPVASITLPAPAIDVPVGSSLGCNNADAVLIINGANCAMTSLPAASAIPNATTVTLADNTAVTAGAAVNNANLSCMGTWNEVRYAVNAGTGNLERSIGGGAPTPMVAGIVNLQAQYGVAAAGVSSAAANFNQVTQWVNATGATWAAPTVADRNRIKAIRIAVVARNAKMEPNAVTTAAVSTWAGTASSPAPTVDLSVNDPNWQQYRYRVFDTIIPLRNVIWSKGTL